MDQRITRALAAGTVLALPLLAACGAATTPAGSPAAPATSAASTPSTAAAPSTSAAASPSASTPPSDEAEVRAAGRTFMTTVFAFQATDSYADYRGRVEPLMTKKGVASFEAAHLDQALEQFRTRYGKQARNVTKVDGTPKVTGLTSDHATVAVSFENRIQQRRDGTWRTVKSAKDSVKLPMEREGTTWLVGDIG